MAFVLGLRERKKLATREALGTAALRLAIERGLENVLVEDIAAEAGVSPRTFNNYFSSKYEAICSLAVDRAHRIGDALRARPATESLWSAIIHAVLDEYDTSDLPPDPVWMAGARLVMNAAALQGEYLKAHAVMRDALAEAIAERTGADLAKDMHPRIVAGAVSAAVEVAMTRWINADPPTAALPVVREALRQLALIPGGFPMDVPTSHTLAVPGASLYYEVCGTGPVFLLIPGGNGDAGSCGQLAPLLADRFTVVSYDRRGFTRSPLDGPPERRVETDVADASRLLAHLTSEPAYVFGSSSGAIVGLELLSAHPEQVRLLVAHEPPLVSVLPDRDEWLAFFNDVYETNKREGGEAAMVKFSAGVGIPMGNMPSVETLPPEIAEMVARVQKNLQFFMEHEIRQYPRVVPDIEALRASVSKLVLAVGEDSVDTLPARPNGVLAGQLGLDTVLFPGNHIGYVGKPAEFAERLVKSVS